jgi:N-ethylmaleimide reductase
MATKLFAEALIGPFTLTNRVVMAPMTRSRAVQHNAPNELVATYYEQRASAGLIITEGTSPSANGIGYARIPGIYSSEQIEGWKRVTKAVHAKGGHIFVQLMHCGRIAHELNLPAGAEILAPSAIAAKGDMWTDQEGMKPLSTPRAMNIADVKATIKEFVQAAKNAIEAGFDGVEIHGANGYLIDQFINPVANQRTDEYGGSIENRSRFLLEIAAATAKAIGKDRVGVRVSPYGAFNDVSSDETTEDTHAYIARQLNDLGILYIHIVNHSAMGAPEVPASVIEKIRKNFTNVLILSGGYDAQRAEQDVQSGAADLVAFGRPFIANPDLVERLQSGVELAQPDYNTFYTADAKGYTDYPVLKAQAI